MFAEKTIKGTEVHACTWMKVHQVRRFTIKGSATGGSPDRTMHGYLGYTRDQILISFYIFDDDLAAPGNSTLREIDEGSFVLLATTHLAKLDVSGGGRSTAGKRLNNGDLVNLKFTSPKIIYVRTERGLHCFHPPGVETLCASQFDKSLIKSVLYG